MNYLELCVDPGYTVKETMDVIESHRERGVVVVEFGKVCGVLTLGNIISALSNGRDIFSKIADIYNPNFVYLQSFDYERAFEIFKNKNLSFIPVVDNDFHLIGIITPREIMAMVTFFKK